MNKIKISMLVLVFSLIAVCSKAKDPPVIKGCNIFEYDGKTYDYSWANGSTYGCTVGIAYMTIQQQGGPKFGISCKGDCMESVQVLK
jgi:hypothetical protein